MLGGQSTGGVRHAAQLAYMCLLDDGVVASPRVPLSAVRGGFVRASCALCVCVCMCVCVCVSGRALESYAARQR